MTAASESDPTRAIEALHAAGIPHALIGGMAANIYRHEFRRTYDFDFLVATFEGLQTALEAAGFEIEIGTHGTQDQWLIRASADDVGFDFSLAEIDIQKLTIRNAETNSGVATAEDLVILKLIANRKQDLDDLSSIIRGGRVLDLEYVRSWSAELDREFETAPRFRRFRDLYLEQHADHDGQDLDGPSLGPSRT